MLELGLDRLLQRKGLLGVGRGTEQDLDRIDDALASKALLDGVVWLANESLTGLDMHDQIALPDL